MVERRTNRALISQTWEYWLDAAGGGSDWDDWKLSHNWPLSLNAPGEGDTIHLPKPPLQSVSSVKYYTTDNTVNTYSTDNYTVDTQGGDGAKYGRIFLNQGKTWPTNLRSRIALQITYVAGYGDAGSSVPGAIKTAITRIVASMYEHRGDAVDEDSLVDAMTKSLLAPYEVPKL
jgi:uncharacterized phiE125 gp8 family phage protein